MASRYHPPPNIAKRLRACRELLWSRRLDGYLVSLPADQYYLTGFEGEDGAVLILRRSLWLITDGRFATQAARSAPWASALVRTGPLASAVRRLVRRHGLSRLGFQPEGLSVHTYARLRRELRPARLVPVPEAVQRLRLLKDDTEIAAIEQAVRVAEAAFRAATRRIRVGMTEAELAANLQHEMLRRGASQASFPIIVAEGPNAALPHARPGLRRLRAGSPVLIDWGATVANYRSDLTRVVFVRRIPPRFRRMYECVLAAQREAIQAIGPGRRMCDVDAVARRVLKQAGLDRHFVHGLGHGLGLDIHEPPRLAKHATEPLQAGMVVTVEPGVYLPDVGGVRIEDDVVVTPTGCRVLSGLPKDLDLMVV